MPDDQESSDLTVDLQPGGDALDQFDSEVSTPENENPETMTPETMTPETMNPETMNPETMNPENVEDQAIVESSSQGQDSPWSKPATAGVDEAVKAEKKPGRSAVTVILAVGLVLALGFSAGYFLFVYPHRYLLIKPGGARAINPLISVDGGPDYKPKGEFLLLTVAVGEPVWAGEALQGWLDDTIDVPLKKDIYGGTSKAQFQAQNVAAMNDAKQVAAYVALTRIGYTITEHGDGAFVLDVASDAPAAKVLKHGDVITAVDGAPIMVASDLYGAVGDHKPGDMVELSLRGTTGETRTESVKLTSREDGTAIIGVIPQTADQTLDWPFKWDINSLNISGPSAGLAFTLAFLDRVTPGELSGSHRIAVTGTIAPDGSVGNIGGVKQKVAAARAQGADLMLVPADEEADAMATAGDLKIVGVKNVDEAVAALEKYAGADEITEFKAAS